MTIVDSFNSCGYCKVGESRSLLNESLTTVVVSGLVPTPHKNRPDIIILAGLGAADHPQQMSTE